MMWQSSKAILTQVVVGKTDVTCASILLLLLNEEPVQWSWRRLRYSTARSLRSGTGLSLGGPLGGVLWQERGRASWELTAVCRPFHVAVDDYFCRSCCLASPRRTQLWPDTSTSFAYCQSCVCVMVVEDAGKGAVLVEPGHKGYTIKDCREVILLNL